MKKNIKFYAIIMSLLILSGFTKAQNFSDAYRLSQPFLGNSARAMGMGNAVMAVGGDYSSALYNPAGLALIKHAELSGGFEYGSFDNTSTFFNQSTNYSVSNTSLNQFGFAFPFQVVRGSMVLAFGYNRVNDFNSSVKFSGFNPNNNSMIQDLAYYNDDIAYELGLSYPLYDGGGNYLRDTTLVAGLLNQSGSIIEEGGIDSWSLSGAVEIAKNVFAGVSLNILSGSYKSSRDYNEEDTKNRYGSSFLLDPADSRTADFQSFYFNDIVNWDITGWEMKLGLLYKMNNHMNLAFAIKLPTYYTVKELYTVYGESYFSGASFNIDPAYRDEIEYDITTPFEFSGGISGKIAGFRLAADFNFIDYTQLKFDGGLDPTIEARNNREIMEVFRRVVNYSAGLEYRLPVFGITLRTGYIFNKSPYKSDNENFDKKYYTFGAGINPNRNVALDFAVIKGSWTDYFDNYGVNVSRVNQSIDKNKFVFTIRYNY